MIRTLSGNFHDMPIEVFESKFPARITDYRYRQDSAGPGRWRGGNGIIREYQMTTDTEMSLRFERSDNPAWGLFAGNAGAPPEVIINPRTPRETRRLKTNRMPLRKGNTVRCYTGGGGGYGNPPERDPQAVLTDLTDGHITPDYAKRHRALATSGKKTAGNISPSPRRLAIRYIGMRIDSKGTRSVPRMMMNSTRRPGNRRRENA